MPILDLLSQPIVFVAWLAAIIYVLTIHEFSHALAGTWLGDSTARLAGRLTLNPLAHVSWLGFFMLLLVGFGWGKPVPFNPYNLKYPRVGPALVAIAGPLSNLISAIIFIVIFKIFFPAVHPLFLIMSDVTADSLNLAAVFLSLAIFLNLILMIFNLIPIPPLDGSKILFAIIADGKYAGIRHTLEDRGPMILLIIIMMDSFIGTNILGGIVNGVLNLVFKLVA